jgi:tetratricopeptide (TPR) repeat protein
MTILFHSLFMSVRLTCGILPAVLALALLAASPARADDYDDVGALMRSGRMADALRQADAYLTNRPRDPQMRFLKGMIQRETGKIDEAMASFKSLTEDYPELPEPHNNLAVLYASRNDIDKARAALEMAIRANPEYATAHENLGDVYTRLSATAYARAQQLDPANTRLGPKISALLQIFGGSSASAPVPPASPAQPTPLRGKAP